ncbi:hypothetical protein [Streptomyces lydicus]|uniref:hypothetical protein n=1 Tax=Streptomyces lydicus TaxID=47763 RepID=UPI0013E97C22|nr:hypothetical protein [Streptomyces lydicus]MCZ1012648.1 hypothetical protein [Streptomyces lydicus]
MPLAGPRLTPWPDNAALTLHLPRASWTTSGQGISGQNVQSTPKHGQLLLLETEQLTEPTNFRLRQLTAVTLLDQLPLQHRDVSAVGPHRRVSLDSPRGNC